MTDVNKVLSTVNATDKAMATGIGNTQVMLKRSINKLEKRIVSLYKTLEVDGSGNLVGPRVNLKQSQKIHQDMVNLFEEEYGKGARRAVAGYNDVAGLIQREFKEFGISAAYTGVDRAMINTLKEQAYAEYVQFGTAAQEVIAQTMYDTVAAGGSFNELVGVTRGILMGGRDARGRSMAAYATQWANDGVMNFHQSVTLQKANDADLRSFLYYGDIITTSRQFCIDRVGKVYSKKQINSWNDLNWAGKSGAPLTYRGGYNCRHHWHPIKKEWVPGGEIPIQDIYKEQGIKIPRGITLPTKPAKKKLTNVFLSKHQGRVTGQVLNVPGGELDIGVYDDSIVDSYAKRIKAGETFTPTFVHKDDIKRVLDGNHRAAAYTKLGKNVPVTLVDRTDMLNKMGTGNMTATEYFNTIRAKEVAKKTKQLTKSKFIPAKTKGEAQAITEKMVADGKKTGYQNDGAGRPLVKFNHTHIPKKGGHPAYEERVRKTLYGQARNLGALELQANNLINEGLEEFGPMADAMGIPRVRTIRVVKGGSAGASMGDGVMLFNSQSANKWKGFTGDQIKDTAGKLQQSVDKLEQRVVFAKTTGTTEEVEFYKDKLKAKKLELEGVKKGQLRGWNKKREFVWGKTDISRRSQNSGGYYEFSDDKLRSTFWHEAGHHVHQQLFVYNKFGYDSPYMEGWLRTFVKQHGGPAPTIYGDTNAYEWFAENFSLWKMGNKHLVSPPAVKLLKSIDDLIDGKITKDKLQDKMAKGDFIP